MQREQVVRRTANVRQCAVVCGVRHKQSDSTIFDLRTSRSVTFLSVNRLRFRISLIWKDVFCSPVRMKQQEHVMLAWKYIFYSIR